MQGVIKSYDPTTGDGVVLCDTDLNDYDLAADALDGSIFRMLRQGQRVVFRSTERAGDRAQPRQRDRHGDPGLRLTSGPTCSTILAQRRAKEET